MSMQDKGLPLDPDLFSTGRTANGCGHATRTVSRGFRVTAADYVTKDRQRSNITIMHNTIVDKVKLEKHGNSHRAIAVDAVFADKSKSTFTARKEIVISAGVYCSPAILLRSGIGAKEELEQHKIPCQVDLPGVGKNLIDHLVSYHESWTKAAQLTLPRLSLPFTK